METAPEPRGRWALLIGIDRYQLHLGFDLEGCSNDVAIMRDALRRRFGFGDDQITVLCNEQATRENILAGMEALVRRTEKGGEAVFFYSGHGSKQSDGEEKDEADGFDETLVPYDSGRDPFPNQDISDDEIYLWLLRLTAKASFVTLIFDCCHSGTILRDGFAGKQRFVPPDTRPASELAARIPPESFEFLRGGEDSPAALQRLGKNYVALLSCGSEETSNEFRPGKRRRTAYSALTYFLVRTLMDPDFRGATWREVFERVGPQVTAEFPTQHPELEGAQDRQVFGAREIQPMKYVPVERREGNVIVLGAGEACGLTEGSLWDVYAPATRSIEDEKYVGQVEIIKVEVTSSEAQEVKGDERARLREPVRPGMRAVESERSLPGVRLSVEIAAPPGNAAAQDLAERMKRSRFLYPWERKTGDFNPEDRADIRVYLLEPRSCWEPEDPAPMLGPVFKATWAPVGRDGALVAPAFPLDYPESVVEKVIENLDHVARLRGLAGIRNDGSPLRKQVDFLVHRLEDGRCAEPALKVGETPVFFVGERLVLEVHNRSEQRLFFYILDVGLTGKVSPVFPPLGSNEPLEPDHGVCVGLHRYPLKLCIPPEFQLLHRVPEGKPAEGLETLKLFVTPSPADFKPLYEEGMRFPEPLRLRSTWSLNDVLDATFHGGKGYMRTKEDWTVIDKTFLLRSR